MHESLIDRGIGFYFVYYIVKNICVRLAFLLKVVEESEFFVSRDKAYHKMP